MEGGIASCHWHACEDCKHITDEGCSLVDVSYDFDPDTDEIVCLDYESEHP